MEKTLLGFKKGAIIFKEGDLSNDLYIIQEGTVKVYKEVDGKKLPLALVKTGQFIGELSFFDGKPRSATAEAATDVKLLQVKEDNLKKEIKKLPSWLLVLISSIATRMRDTDDLVKRNKILDAQMAEEFNQLG